MRDDYWASHLNGVFQVPDAGHAPAGCQPDGDQEVEHTSANRCCYGDEIAMLRSQ